MPVGPLDLLWLALLGGWLTADGTTLGQFMVSRPFVAASLAGLIVGDPVAGAALGLLLEAYDLSVLPVGAARYPEGAPGAVVAGAVFAAGPDTPSRLLLTAAFALGWGWLGGQTLHQLRQFNVGFVALRLRRGAWDLERRHMAAVAIDVLRGMALVAVGVLALSAAMAVLEPLWGLDERITRMLAGGILAGLLASSFRLFGARLPWFLAGALGGVALLLIAG